MSREPPPDRQARPVGPPDADQLLTLLRLSADYYWQQDAEFRFTWYSLGVEHKTGKSLANLLGRTRWEIAQADVDDPKWRAHMETLQRHEPFSNFEIGYRADDGTPRWSSVSGMPKFNADGEFAGYYGAARDITARKGMEEALRKSEERFRDFARASSDWFSETDAEGRYTWVSPSIQGRRQVEPGWYLGKRRIDIAAPGEDLAQEPWKSHLETLARHEPFRDFRYVTRDPGGEAVISVSAIPFFDEEGRFLGYRNSGSDITERVSAERRAREADERLRAAIEHLAEAVALCDAEDRFVIVNREFARINAPVAESFEPGRTFEEFLRAAVAKGLFPDAQGHEEEWLDWRMKQRRQPAGPYEVRRQNAAWLMVSEERLPDGGMIFFALEITALKRAEAERFEEARRQRDALVREVHHRIKNSLQGVTGLLSLEAVDQPQAAPALREAASRIQAIAKVHGLRGRGESALRLGALVEEIITTLRDIAPVPIRLEAAGECHWVLPDGDAVPIALVVNELVWNAVKHRSGGAEVSVWLEAGEAGATLRVENAGAMGQATHAGQAAGLALVRTLLPSAGARLHLESAGGVVCARLALAPPALIPARFAGAPRPRV